MHYHCLRWENKFHTHTNLHGVTILADHSSRNLKWNQFTQFCVLGILPHAQSKIKNTKLHTQLFAWKVWTDCGLEKTAWRVTLASIPITLRKNLEVPWCNIVLIWTSSLRRQFNRSTTNLVKLSPSWQLTTVTSLYKKTPSIWWNPKVHYHVHPHPELNEPNPFP
jgi:hypothetical protein